MQKFVIADTLIVCCMKGVIVPISLTAEKREQQANPEIYDGPNVSLAVKSIGYLLLK